MHLKRGRINCRPFIRTVWSRWHTINLDIQVDSTTSISDLNNLDIHVYDTLSKSLTHRGVCMIDSASSFASSLTAALRKRVSQQQKPGSRDYNRLFKDECEYLTYWLLHVATDDEVLSMNLDLEKIIMEMKLAKVSGQKTYVNITDHHNNIRKISWNNTVQNEKALIEYSLAAQEMGQRPWVTESNRWMVRTIHNFFHGGGARRHFCKDILKHTQCPSSDMGVREWIRSLAPPNGLSSSEKLRVLDVGSCYNPLVGLSQEEGVDMIVTALDLCPAENHVDSVFQCDFLALNIGPPFSLPIVSSVTDDDESSQLKKPTRRQLIQLPAEGYNVVCMSLVMSYLPSDRDRRRMIIKARDLLTKPVAASPINKHSTSKDISSECLAYGLLLIVEPYSSKRCDGSWIGGSSQVSHTSAHTSNVITSLQHLTHEMETLGFQKVDIQPLVVHHGKLPKRKAITMAFRTTSTTPMGSRKFSTQVPPVGIVGCGIGGAALARKLEREKVPYVVFERDANVSSRRQGYALTLQQGLVALRDLDVTADLTNTLALSSLERHNCNKQHFGSDHSADQYHSHESSDKGKHSTVLGCTSTHSHISLTNTGRVIGVYGAPAPAVSISLFGDELFTEDGFAARNLDGHMSTHCNADEGRGSSSGKSSRGRRNVHMPRQSLREALLDGVPSDKILWKHRLQDVKQIAYLNNNNCDTEILLTFECNRQYSVCGLVGADGIYSAVRQKCISPVLSQSNIADPLRYLGLVVILGICPTLVRNDIHTEMDSWTHGQMSFIARDALMRSSGTSLSRRKVQWLDGNTRVFSMPYDEDNTMWQMSFRMDLDAILEDIVNGSEGK